MLCFHAFLIKYHLKNVLNICAVFDCVNYIFMFDSSLVVFVYCLMILLSSDVN